MGKPRIVEKVSLFSIHKEHGIGYQAINNRVEAMGIEIYYIDSTRYNGRKSKAVSVDDVDKIIAFKWPKKKLSSFESSAICKTGSRDISDNIKAGYYGRITAIGRMRTEQGLKHER